MHSVHTCYHTAPAVPNRVTSPNIVQLLRSLLEHVSQVQRQLARHLCADELLRRRRPAKFTSRRPQSNVLSHGDASLHHHGDGRHFKQHEEHEDDPAAIPEVATGPDEGEPGILGNGAEPACLSAISTISSAHPDSPEVRRRVREVERRGAGGGRKWGACRLGVSYENGGPTDHWRTSRRRCGRCRTAIGLGSASAQAVQPTVLVREGQGRCGQLFVIDE